MATLIGDLTNNANLIGRVGSSAISTIAGMVLTGPPPSTKWRNKIIRDRFIKNALKPKAEPNLSDLFEPNLVPHLQLGYPTSGVYNSGIMTISPIANELIREAQKKAKDSILNESIYTPLVMNGKPKSFSSTVDITKVMDNINTRKKTQLKLYILNATSSPYQYVELQNRPSFIRANPESQWATIKSMGRNVPMYHFTGAEDTIEMTLSWYLNSKEHPDDVLNKVRLLESWSKANGYVSSPPILQLVFGYDGPFQNHYYILFSTNYEMRNFMVPQYNSDGSRKEAKFSGNNIDYHTQYYPSVINQTLVFKRVSDTNPTWEDIIPSKKLQYTSGVTMDATQQDLDSLYGNIQANNLGTNNIPTTIPLNNTVTDL